MRPDVALALALEALEDEPLRPLNHYSFVSRFSGDTGMCLNMLDSRTSRGKHAHALTSATVSRMASIL